MGKAKGKVLYISYDGMTDPLGQSQVIPYLVGLREKGYAIKVVSFEKPEPYRKNKGIISRIFQDNDIAWVACKYHKSPAILATFYDVFVGMWIVFLNVVFRGVRLVHCRGHYTTSLMAYPFVSTIRSLKYVFDMRGFWADERFEGNIWDPDNKKHKALYDFFKRMEKRFIKRADYVVTLTNKAKDYILKNFESKGKIEVIPCCADLELFALQTPKVRDDYRKKLGVEGEFLLVYLGSIGTWYMLDEMMEFFSVLKQEHSQSKLLFLTLENPNTLFDAALKKGIVKSDLIVTGAARQEIPCYLSACDASIFFIRPVFSKSGSSPTKHGEILGCGLPLVCNSNIGDVDDIVKGTDTGVIVDAFDTDSYQSAAKVLINQKAEGKEKFLSAANEYYSLRKGTEKYFDIYQELL